MAVWPTALAVASSTFLYENPSTLHSRCRWMCAALCCIDMGKNRGLFGLFTCLLMPGVQLGMVFVHGAAWHCTTAG